MKDGHIVAMGDLDDIIKADPDMYEEIKQVAAVGWDDDGAETAEEERHILQRNVSKISMGIIVYLWSFIIWFISLKVSYDKQCQ